MHRNSQMCRLHRGFTLPQTALHPNRDLGMVCATQLLLQLKERVFQGPVRSSCTRHCGRNSVQQVRATLSVSLDGRRRFQTVSAGTSSLSPVHSCPAGHGGQQGEGLAATAAAGVTSLRRAGSHRLADTLAVAERACLGLRQAVVDATVLARGLFENAVGRVRVLEAVGPQGSQAAPTSSSP